MSRRNRSRSSKTEEVEYRFGGTSAEDGDADDGGIGVWVRAALIFLAAWLIIFTPLRVLLLPMAILLFQHVRSKAARSEATRGSAIGHSEELTGAYRSWVNRGRAVQKEIEAVVTRLPASLRRTFWPLTQQSRELMTDLENLSRFTQQMEAYLEGPYGRRTAEEAHRLRARIAGTVDPMARARLEHALHALEDTLADQQEIEGLCERARAEATHINAALQSVLSEVIKQRYSNLETAREEYESASERLRSIKSHADAIQQVITTRSMPGG